MGVLPTMSALECPVCLSEYDSSEHAPRILQCSGAHELCSGCLYRLPASSDGKVKCPQCREALDAAASNPNRSLVALLEVQAQQTAALAAAAAVAEAAEAKAATAAGRLAAAEEAQLAWAMQQSAMGTAAAVDTSSSATACSSVPMGLPVAPLSSNGVLMGVPMPPSRAPPVSGAPPPATYAGTAPLSATFAHLAPTGAWEEYTAAQSSLLAAQMAATPGGGHFVLPETPFEVRWGGEARSQRMPTPPSTGMCQVNLSNGNTRVVRRQEGRPSSGRPLPVPHAALGSALPSSFKILCDVRAGRGRLLLVKGSILDFEGDALVNAANEGCVGGFGVDELVNQAGGPQLRVARQQLGGCPTGEAKITPAFAHAKTRWIVHAVGPAYRDASVMLHGGPVAEPAERERMLRSRDPLLVSAYRNALREAAAQGCRSIGFCLLSAGVFRGSRPLGDVVEIGARTLAHALSTGNAVGSIDTIVLVAYSDDEERSLSAIGSALTAEVSGGGNGAGTDPQGLW